ncbi:MAG: SEL1-like repeat protein [Planctomycetes bacterium]|nr:SEL1-like repeat protein [Planctomycetota bacterium]MCB9920258.1 SEL1-like repeat protein [Planctomycetota bacterium]
MTMQKLLIVSSLLLSACANTSFQALEAYERSDYVVAYPEFKRLAVRGDADAQFFVGLMHDEGNGVDEDKVKASHWYELAAEQDHPAACNNLGLLYFRGEGVPKDTDRAIEFYERAAEHDFAPALTNLGVVHLFGHEEDGEVRGRDIRAAKRLLERAADLGEAKALRILGFMHRRGLGTAKNDEASRGYYERAAALGDETAHYYLATLLLGLESNARGSSTVATSVSDAERGVMHMRAAAGSGLAAAQYGMGMIYLRGIGVAEDQVAARDWLQRAADQGLVEAEGKLRTMAVAKPTSPAR